MWRPSRNGWSNKKSRPSDCSEEPGPVLTTINPKTTIIDDAAGAWMARARLSISYIDLR